MVRIALALASVCLAGCARDATVYPSLAPRAAEKLGFTEPEVTPLKAQPDAALDAALGAQATRLDEIVRGFARDAAAAEQASARSGARTIGGDAWLDAQAALAALDTWRGQASELATALDELGAARAARLLPDYPALVALRGRTQAEIEAEAERTRTLQASLPGD